MKTEMYQVGPDDFSMYGCKDYLWVVHWYEAGDWCGNGWAVSWDGEQLREHNLGHCSCYGPSDGLYTGDAIELSDLESSMVLSTSLPRPLVEKVIELMGVGDGDD